MWARSDDEAVCEAGPPPPPHLTLPKISAGGRAGESDYFFATFLLLFAADGAAIFVLLHSAGCTSRKQ